jgi:CubicO group peptidase (beta-lactamase class C family)
MLSTPGNPPATNRMVTSCRILYVAGLMCIGPGPAFADEVDQYVASQMSALHIPSLGLAVIRSGVPVKVKAYGHANLEHEVLANPDTVYQLASLTKPLVATAVMRLVQDGPLKLEDRVTAHVERLPGAWDEITVAQLLSHTSGLRDYVNPRLLDANKVYTPHEIVEQVARQSPRFAPGQRWEYSNTNYLLLGMLIQAKSGKRFDRYLADQVFRPLGMAVTGRRDLEQICPHRAAAYDWRSDRFTNSRYLEPSKPFASGIPRAARNCSISIHPARCAPSQYSLSGVGIACPREDVKAQPCPINRSS